MIFHTIYFKLTNFKDDNTIINTLNMKFNGFINEKNEILYNTYCVP
jgi:hypothetical protein